MSAYGTVVVGTDGSDTSLRAVERAAEVAGDAKATLVVVCAYHPASKREVQQAEQGLGSEVYQVVGSAPAESTLRDAAARANQHGAADVKTVALEGDASEVLVKAVVDHKADLLVVGNRGLNTLAGRLLGSVPAEVARQAGCDVLIVRTKA